MSFREKSAWGMSGLLAAAGFFYLWILVAASQASSATAPAAIAILVTLLVVVGSITVQVVLAIASPREASAAADERERLVTIRAGHWSGLLFGTWTILALGLYLVLGDGNMLFHLLLGGLIVSQIAEYALEIVLLRGRA